MACLSTIVAVSLAGFTAMHCDVTDLTTPTTKARKHRKMTTGQKKERKKNMLILKRRETATLTCSISPYHIASGCDRTRRRSSTSARWHDRSHAPCGQLCHRCSTAAPSPSWAPCNPWKCDHSCGSCSTLTNTRKSVQNRC